MTGKSIGAVWRRWDPHIHAPGTLFSDKFKGQNAWEDYLSAIETSEPRVRALGVTDYYGLDLYETLVGHKKTGRLADVDLIFPNIELRLAVGLPKGKAINIHLLVSPEEEDHVERAKEFLQGLTFDDCRCDRLGLIRLGKKQKAGLSDAAALEEGAKQFKVSFDELEGNWLDNPWARQNILIAVASSNNDGTAGLQDDGFAALRVRIERFAHIIFASQPAQRSFWLGQTDKASLDEIRDKWNGPKLCLHGSDAHEQEKVAAPALDRFCWLKGDVTFDALRHACIEPELRAIVAADPPTGAFANQTIEEFRITGAPWLKSGDQPINAGLVAIIGARGSGKTALADLVAAGAHAQRADPEGRSFIARAQKNKLLSAASTTLRWANNETTARRVADLDLEGDRVQYLPQHFVDYLCSSEGENDALLGEIERVVYQSHPSGDRLGTTTFDELRDRPFSQLMRISTSSRAAFSAPRPKGCDDRPASTKRTPSSSKSSMAAFSKARPPSLSSSAAPRMQKAQARVPTI